VKKLIIPLLLIISFLHSVKVQAQPIVGETAPEITGLKMINNDFPDLANKFVFLDFWATWSTSEVHSLAHLNTLAKRFKDKIVFLAVSEENEEHVRSFLQPKQWDNIYFGLDIDQALQKNFAVEDVPVYYLISPDNIILSSGVSNEIEDAKLDSLVTKNDSINAMNRSNIVIPRDKSRMISSLSKRLTK